MKQTEKEEERVNFRKSSNSTPKSPLNYQSLGHSQSLQEAVLSDTDYENTPILNSNARVFSLPHEKDELEEGESMEYFSTDAVFETNEKDELAEIDNRTRRIVNPLLGFLLFLFILLFNFLFFYSLHYFQPSNYFLLITWVKFIDFSIVGLVFFHVLYHTIIQFTANSIFQRFIAKGRLKKVHWTCENFYFDFIVPQFDYHGLTILSSSFCFFLSYYFFFFDFEKIFISQNELIYQFSVALFLGALLWFSVILFISILRVYSYGELLTKFRKNQTEEKVLIKAEESVIRSLFLYRATYLFSKPLFINRTTSLCLRYLRRAERRGKESDVALRIAHEFLRKQKYPAKGHIDMQDAMELLHQSQYETDIFFRLFDTDGDGKITAENFAEGLEQMYSKRQSIIHDLKSCHLIVNVTFTLLKLGVAIACLLLLLNALYIDVTTLIVSIGTLLLAFSFAYSTTLQEVFDSLYMIYIAKPFKIGDIISIDGGSQLIVEQQGILSTKFYSEPFGYAVYYRNRGLVHARIDNMNRCKRVAFEIFFGLHMDTTHLQMLKFEQLLKNFFQQSKVWRSDFEFYADNLSGDSQSLRYVLRCTLRGDNLWQNRNRWTSFKSELILKIQELSKGLGIIQSPLTYNVLFDNRKIA